MEIQFRENTAGVATESPNQAAEFPAVCLPNNSSAVTCYSFVFGRLKDKLAKEILYKYNQYNVLGQNLEIVII